MASAANGNKQVLCVLDGCYGVADALRKDVALEHIVKHSQSHSRSRATGSFA